jgi:hydroxypyruvate reductase
MVKFLLPWHNAYMGDATPEFLRGIFAAAIAAANPAQMLAKYLPAPGPARNIVIGAGKAAASMAAALEAAWPDTNIEGVVVTRYGHATPTQKIKVREASHPVPDAAGEAAAREILAEVTGLTPQDQVIALISGGASALLALPVPGLKLSDKQLVAKALLASGAPIDVMNRIRKQLSAVKGGKLAAACAPAKLITLAISDVPGDSPAIIGSGPTWHEGADYRLIATSQLALEAAAAFAARHNIPAQIQGDALEGESADLGRELAAKALATTGPVLLLSGGETTVTIGSGQPGRGGRNTEFLLSLAIALNGARHIHAIAGDSDGIDGTEDAAGAIIGPDSLARAAALGLNAAAMLAAHDSYSLFAALGDLVITGPTLTNVNDIRAILIN